MTFTEVVIKRMGGLIETANKDSAWEMEAAAEMMKAVHLLRSVAQAAASPTAEDIYACCRSTLIGFRDELTEQQIKFICDQIARKSTLPSTMQLCPDWRTCKCKDGCAHSSTNGNTP